MGVDLKLENQNGTMATFRNVAEIAIPKADGSGDQVFGLGGASSTHTATVSASGPQINGSKATPPGPENIENTVTATFTTPANSVLVEYHWHTGGSGVLVRYYGDDPNNRANYYNAIEPYSNAWDDTSALNQNLWITETPNLDGSVTITVTWKPFYPLNSFPSALMQAYLASGRLIDGRFQGIIYLAVTYVEY